MCHLLMHKPGGTNVGTGSCVNGSYCILWIYCRKGWAVADGGAQHAVSGKGMTVAGGTLGSSATPTLGAVALGDRAGLTFRHKFWIAVLQLAASMAVVGMVLCNVQRTLHATRTMRSAVEIVGIAQ
jgi:hypothetical protein